MKTNLISLLSGLLLVVQYSHAQIDVPNGDFESWGLYNSWNYTPQDWNTGNFQLHEHVFIDSLAFEGEKAMKVYPYTFFEPYPGYASTYFELPNETPASLDFYYKSFIGTDVEVDSVYVSIQLFSDDILMLDHSWNTDETQLEWTEVHLMTEPLGKTISYASLAEQCGGANYSRAVAAANGANPILLFVPCHRVIGSDGPLSGYAGGLDRKSWLLDHESGQRSLF